MDLDTLQAHIEQDEQEKASRPWYIRIPVTLGEFIWYRIVCRIPDWHFEIKWWIQDIFRGYSEKDIWGLNDFIIRKVRPPLKRYVKYTEEEGHSLPMDFQDNEKGWLEVLKKIEFAFDSTWEDDYGFDAWHEKTKDWTPEQSSEHYKKVQEGFELFGKYLLNLWD